MPVSAQDGPSYEETVSFLQEKLNTARQESSYSTYNHFVELEHCEFAVIQSESRPSENWVWLFNPSLFDPSQVGVEARSRVTATTKQNKRIVPAYNFASRGYLLEGGSTMSEYGPCNESPEYNEMFRTEQISRLITIPTEDRYCANNHIRNGPFLGEFLLFQKILSPAEDNAPRVAKALKHLILLCGGAEQLF